MPMETSTKETGKMEKLTVTESLLISKDQCMRVNGQTINSTEWELKLGIKDK
jgi:hypothetical protein